MSPQVEAHDSLLPRIASGLGWDGSSLVLRAGIAMVTLAVVGRLLTSSDFGLYAMIWTVIGTMVNVAQAGAASALVQKRDVDEDHLTAAFAIMLSAALLAAVLAILAAPWLATFFREPQVSSTLRLAAFGTVAVALPHVHLAHLRRNFLFRQMALIQLGAAVVSNSLIIALAVGGFGVWSLLAGPFANGLAAFALYRLVGPWGLNRRPAMSKVRSLLRFSGHTSLTVFVATIYNQLPTIVIGRVLGADALGIFAIATRVLNLLRQYLGTLGNVFLPAFSAVQQDISRLGRAYLLSVRLTAVLMFPMFMGLAVVANQFVPVFLGPEWSEAIPILRVMSLAYLVLLLSANVTTAFQAIGRPDTGWKLNVGRIILYIPVLRWSATYGLLGVALAFLALSAATALCYQRWLSREIRIPTLSFFQQFVAATVGMIVMSAAVVALDRRIASAGLGLELALLVLTGAAVYTGTVLFVDRSFLAQALGVLRSRTRT